MCTQSCFKPIMPNVLLWALRYFFLTCLFLPKGSISLFPALQCVKTQQLKHHTKQSVNESDVCVAHPRDRAINKVISKVNLWLLPADTENRCAKCRGTALFSPGNNKIVSAQTTKQPTTLLSYLFTTLFSLLVCSRLIFSSSVAGAGRVVSKKRRQRSQRRNERSRPAEIRTGSIFLPLPF